jgi:hypothetical protein
MHVTSTGCELACHGNGCHVNLDDCNGCHVNVNLDDGNGCHVDLDDCTGCHVNVNLDVL